MLLNSDTTGATLEAHEFVPVFSGIVLLVVFSGIVLLVVFSGIVLLVICCVVFCGLLSVFLLFFC
jgi:hypothetical protein